MRIITIKDFNEHLIQQPSMRQVRAFQNRQSRITNHQSLGQTYPIFERNPNPNQPGATISIENDDWFSIADTFLNFFYRSRWNKTCARISDGFWNSGSGWLERMIGGGGQEGYIFTPQGRAMSDSQVRSIVQQTCQRMRSALVRVPHCGQESANERPCAGPWRVPGVEYPSCCQGVDSYVDHQLAIRAQSAPNDPAAGRDTYTKPGGSNPDASTILLVGGIGLGALLLITALRR